jgi:hypothetical protein
MLAVELNCESNTEIPAYVRNDGPTEEVPLSQALSSIHNDAQGGGAKDSCDSGLRPE